MKKIRDFLQVHARPTVVRLEHLESGDAGWISKYYFITREVRDHLQALRHLFSRENGSGVFVIGHYGCGKSHFLAYLAREIAGGSFCERALIALPISLLNYSAGHALESILQEALGIEVVTDRREAWSKWRERYPEGVLLILDELSEFLRSKPSVRGFNEDIRFLQFMGEWAQDHPFWIVAALQEQIEHTGEMEYDLFRKIKDRYPIRMILSPAHVKDLISSQILEKKEGYEDQVAELVKRLRQAFPESPMDYAELARIYPIHPVSLEILEEVRDRFSQARGIVGFVIQQMLGDEARAITPFLDEPWGRLLSPDAIVDHFQDLFQVQPEFLPLAQKLFPYYRKHLALIFDTETQRLLAEQLLKLMVLVFLSPARELLTPAEAAWWLLPKISTLQPEKNVAVVARVLEGLADRGAFIKRSGAGFAVDLEENSQGTLETLIERGMRSLADTGAALFENLVPYLKKEPFNPFDLDRDCWSKQSARWHFHRRDFQVYFGGGAQVLESGPGLQIGIPWGEPAEGRGCYRLIPEPLTLTTELKELAVLDQLRESPLPRPLLAKVAERIATRRSLFHARILAAYQRARLLDPTGQTLALPREGATGNTREWVSRLGVWILRRTYPQFEAYAPSHGPLPREAYRELMNFALNKDLEAEEAPEYVKLIREAYLVPMKLMVRRGRSYGFSPKLDQHELVLLLRPLIDHQPSPQRIYKHLAEPVYGLVDDQVHLLLLVLMIQGEIEILKGRSSYRDLYETLPTPRQYDRIVRGRALSLERLKDLQILCEAFKIPMSPRANVLAQRRSARLLKTLGQKRRDRLSMFLARLREFGDTGDLAEKLERHIQAWGALEKGENEVQGVQLFLFEIGSPRRFLQTDRELSALPQKVEGLIAETRRLRHLFGSPVFSDPANGRFGPAVEHLEEPPGLGEPDALEAWIETAKTLYRDYQVWYRNTHDAWWRELKANDVWRYASPAIAKSRHLGLSDQRTELEALKNRAGQQICRNLSNLDFQPQCLCGFDGKSTAVEETVLRLEGLREEIETELMRFFQSEKVRERVRQWHDQGLETHERSLSYLEEEAPFPEISNINLFDQHLAGLDLIQEADLAKVTDLLCERVWEKPRLVESFRVLLNRYGPRLVFRKPEPSQRTSLLPWCLEQSLRTGKPLPRGLSSEELRLVPELIRPEWVSPVALVSLETLGLGREGERRVLRLVLEGAMALPERRPARGPVAALCDLCQVPEITKAADFVARITLLYREHPAMMALDAERWLAHLDARASQTLSQPLPLLYERLADFADSQWWVIDALGVPLLSLLEDGLESWLPHWRKHEISFALVGEETHTEGFFRDLAAGPAQHALLKWNGLDRLVHEFKGSFRDLENLARAELENACRKREDLDPARRLLIFADHGFRLSPGGSGFTHGGDSTLERLVPVIELEPYS